MEKKTQVHAEEGKQHVVITREFDLPVDLLFKAHTDAELFAEWMGTRVLKLEARRHGSWQFETSDPKGNVVVRAHGVFHDVVENRGITRTFQMEGDQFDVQLEFFEFESLSAERSKLTIHSIYRTPALRDQQLSRPFAYGINMAHNRLQEIVSKHK